MKPSWLIQKEIQAKKTKIFDLSDKKINDLTFLDQYPYVKCLNLSNLPIDNLIGLKIQDEIECLIADNSNLSSLKNFSALPNLSQISILNTPLSRQKHFSLWLVILYPNISSINGQPVSRILKKPAKQYPKEAKILLNKGLFIEFPCPPIETLQSLLYSLEKSSNIQNDQDTSLLSEKSLISQDNITISPIKAKRSDSSNKKDDDSLFIYNDKDILSIQIQQLFEKYGISIGNENRQQNILHVLETLLQKKHKNLNEETQTPTNN